MARKKRYRNKARSNPKWMNLGWWILGFVTFIVFVLVIQPLRDTLIYKLLWNTVISGVILYFAWVSELRPERPGQIIMTLMAVTFWQTMIIPSQRFWLLCVTLLILVGTVYLIYCMTQDKKNLEINPLLFATLFFSIVPLDAGQKYTYQDGLGSRHWEISLVLALVLGALFWYLISHGILRLEDDRTSEKVFWCIGMVCAVFVLSWTTANNLNYMLDYSLPEQYSMTIVEKDIDSSRSGTDYEFLLTYRGEKIELDVSRSIYYQYEVGDSFPVELYQGFFGDAYYIAE